MPFPTETVRDGVYVELVRSLYATLVPTTIMSIGYVVSFGVMALETGDRILEACAILGVLSSAARIVLLLRRAADAAQPRLDIHRARSFEKHFAATYFQFACLLGASAAYVFVLAPSRFHMLAICLLAGYGAGVAAGVGLRPWIAIPSMLVAIVPAIVAASLHRDPLYWTTAAMTAALLAGGCQSLLGRYRVTCAEVGRRLIFEDLARHDVLTALPNRLALREWFDRHITAGVPQQLLAVHCLDLDDFKPVNDALGHPIGDALLRAVAMRLRRALRPGDIAARLGGDEFAVVQGDLHDADEAAALADRLRRAIAEPFSIEGHEIRVTVSIGYVVRRRAAADLDALLASADQALYAAKGSDGGVGQSDLVAGAAGSSARLSSG
jgi:diguanylate cyclase (GGDEF)-like protein